MYKAKSKHFYDVCNDKIHTDDQMGPKYWSDKISLNKTFGLGFSNH